MSIRNYSNAARPLSLAIRAEADDAVLSVNAPGNIDYPDPPFLLAAERGTPREEIMLCTDKPTSDTFTVIRHFDSTDASAHEAGTSVEHTVAAIDYREANAHVNDDSSHWSPGDMKITAIPVTAGSEPTGWLLCDGRAVSRTTYANLFVALGSGAYYGTGDGSSTFNLPDLRQAFPMGKAASGTGAVLGSKGGFKDASIVTHTHAVSDPGHNHTQNQHNHTQDQHKHTLTGGRHAHAIDGDYGFRIAVTTGEPAGNHIPGAGAGQGVSWSDIDQADILNPLDDTGGVSALDMNNFTATNQPFTATNIAGGTNLTVGNPNQTNVAATDRNLPPWQAVNYLVKT